MLKEAFELFGFRCHELLLLTQRHVALRKFSWLLTDLFGSHVLVLPGHLFRRQG